MVAPLSISSSLLHALDRYALVRDSTEPGKLFCRFPFAGELLRFGDLRRGHERCDYFSIFCRDLVTRRVQLG